MGATHQNARAPLPIGEIGGNKYKTGEGEGDHPSWQVCKTETWGDSFEEQLCDVLCACGAEPLRKKLKLCS